MLHTQLKKGTVISLKLVTGDEIIGTLTSDNTTSTTTVSMNKVTTLVQVPNGQGQVSLTLYPYFHLSAFEDDVVFQSTALLTEPVIASSDWLNVYQQVCSQLAPQAQNVVNVNKPKLDL